MQVCKEIDEIMFTAIKRSLAELLDAMNRIQIQEIKGGTYGICEAGTMGRYEFERAYLLNLLTKTKAPPW